MFYDIFTTSGVVKSFLHFLRTVSHVKNGTFCIKIPHWTLLAPCSPRLRLVSANENKITVIKHQALEGALNLNPRLFQCAPTERLSKECTVSIHVDAILAFHNLLQNHLTAWIEQSSSPLKTAYHKTYTLDLQYFCNYAMQIAEDKQLRDISPGTPSIIGLKSVTYNTSTQHYHAKNCHSFDSNHIKPRCDQAQSAVKVNLESF